MEEAHVFHVPIELPSSRWFNVKLMTSSTQVAPNWWWGRGGGVGAAQVSQLACCRFGSGGEMVVYTASGHIFPFNSFHSSMFCPKLYTSCTEHPCRRVCSLGDGVRFTECASRSRAKSHKKHGIFVMILSWRVRLPIWGLKIKWDLAQEHSYFPNLSHDSLIFI